MSQILKISLTLPFPHCLCLSLSSSIHTHPIGSVHTLTNTHPHKSIRLGKKFKFTKSWDGDKGRSPTLLVWVWSAQPRWGAVKWPLVKLEVPSSCNPVPEERLWSSAQPDPLTIIAELPKIIANLIMENFTECESFKTISNHSRDLSHIHSQ